MPPICTRRLLPAALLLPVLLRATPAMAASSPATVKAFSFEVHGKVQGVYFRATTVERAQQLGLVGWVRNKKSGSVEGVAQGAPEAMDQFKKWLSTGPPAARVDRVDYKDERTLEEAEFDEFNRMATV